MDILKELAMCINWNEAVTDIISSVAATALTAGVGFLFVNKYMSQLMFSKKMKSFGFLSTSTNKQSKKEIEQMCKNAETIKIMYVSGVHYFTKNEEVLKRALENGVKIQFLCSNPNSLFLENIENMEYNYRDSSGKRLREKDKKIATEIYELAEGYKDTGMEIKFYSTEYRLPYVLAYYKDGSIKAWLTVTLPPYKSIKSFVLRGEKKKEEIYDEETNFIDMMETNFDTIWNHSSISLEEFERENNNGTK